ncbi:transcription-repair coupling factor [Ekhidna lutea]|uniref:transcription-repair coupling factor n=1 Tax=Ekhidna lutea TaxID=447679 RepID=UPI000B7848CD|nr:transcription-repair coupling factor [Ekhidna lutea]
MNTKDLLLKYQESSNVEAIAESLNKKKQLRLKGIAGSYDAVLVAATFKKIGGIHLIVLHDFEEASYFSTDLSNFLEDEFISFPSSYKKPYHYEEIENANILQRAEVLNELNDRQNLLIITYPEALSEKVINKRSLVSNTFTAKPGEQLDIEFLADLLITYDFEKTDFVYEPGQFSVRGGIIDVFSYSHEQPYRLELFGDEVETIREFDPESQLSTKELDHISLIPNVQTKLVSEERQSFLDYIPSETVIWLKDHQQSLDIIDKSFHKVEEQFQVIKEMSGDSKLITSPNQLFETQDSFTQSLEKFKKVEFGSRFYLPPDEELTLAVRPQPSFHKNFSLLAESLKELQERNYQKLIAAESFKQIERLVTIFEEIDPEISFDGVTASLREGFIDDHEEICLYTDHQIFDRFHRYKGKEKFTKSKALTLKELKTLQPGDFVTHIDHGVGRFAGLDTVDVGSNKQEAMRLVYRDDDLLYVSLHSLHKVSKYSGKEGEPPSINKLGSPEWENKKKKVKRKVKDIAKDLIQLYAKRKAAQGYAFPPDDYLQAELESSFMYQDTPDQSMATSDVKADMELEHPMDRLVCGDVGFGKTEIAIRAAFKAVNSGKQVAVLVPTTILAMQHHRTFAARLESMLVSIDYINRFKSTKQINDIKKRVKEGKIDILIGTHRIVNKDIEFKDLGLMIIDEEQKFGVKVKERLKDMRVNVDALTLTATPIPRTLHFSLMGARDLSIISTPPPNRRPVTTELHEFNEEVIRDAVSHEVRRGGQVFMVHNRVSDIEQVGNMIFKLVPDSKIGIAHGQMEGAQLEKVMLKFIEGEYDVLVSTNIIESGLDIPNANTIIINNAHMFGLSDLHQMRGRVGRSNTKAYCFMLTPPTSVLTSDARKRLNTLEEFSDLGDGFKVAMRDLDIRGAGNLLGAEQSGFINDMGFDMYHKILDEAVQELKEGEFKQLFETDLMKNKDAVEKMIEDCNVETDFEALIPEDYVSNISERLGLYTKLDDLKSEEELNDFIKMMKDRFGPLPNGVNNLTETVKLRWKAIQIGFEKVTIKNNKMRCYISDKKPQEYFQSPRFGNVLSFIKSNPHDSKMKEVKNKLLISVENVGTISNAREVIEQMHTPLTHA